MTRKQLSATTGIVVVLGRTDPPDEGAVPGKRQDGLEDHTLFKGNVMAWFVLVVSGVLESVWAVALGKTEGFTRLVPSVVFGIALTLSMGGLAYSMRTLPTGTAYAIWVAIGASLTVAYGMASGDEAASLIKVLLLIGLVGCVVGLKLTH